MAAKNIDEQHLALVAEVKKNRDAIKHVYIHDYSSIDSTISIVGADGAKQGSITPPAGVANVKVGQTFKIKVANPADPANLPQDGYQMTLAGSYLWKNKVATDIFNWSEMKNHIANGDTMVLERLEDSGGFKNYQLVKWELGTAGKHGSNKVFVVATGSYTPDTELDIPYDNILSGTLMMAPTMSLDELRSISLMKETNTIWTAKYHTDQGYMGSIEKTANGKTKVHKGDTGLLFAYSITYWKEA